MGTRDTRLQTSAPTPARVEELRAHVLTLRRAPEPREVAAGLRELLASDRCPRDAPRPLRRVRRLAVESLLALGYPYALDLDPEDLVFVRRHRWGRALRRVGLALVFTAMALGLGWWLFDVVVVR